MLGTDYQPQWYEQELQVGEIDPKILVEYLEALFKSSENGYKVDVIHDIYKVTTPRCLKMEEIEKCKYDILRSQRPHTSERSRPHALNLKEGSEIPKANISPGSESKEFDAPEPTAGHLHGSKQMAQGWVSNNSMDNPKAGRWRRKIKTWRSRKTGMLTQYRTREALF